MRGIFQTVCCSLVSLPFQAFPGIIQIRGTKTILDEAEAVKSAGFSRNTDCGRRSKAAMAVLGKLLLPLAAFIAPGTLFTNTHGSEGLTFVKETPEIRVIPRLDTDSAEVLLPPAWTMPVIEPDPAIDYSLVIVAPDPAIDYDLRVIE